MDPVLRLQFHWILCCQWVTGEELAESTEWVQRALAFGERVGIKIFEGFYLSCGASICQIQDDARGAEKYIRRLGHALIPGRRLNESLHLYHER